MKSVKYVVVIGAVFIVLAILLSRLGYYSVTSGLPKFLDSITESAKNSGYVQKRIGKYKSYEYSFNEKELKKDTLNFKVTVIGEDSTLTLTGYALKQNTEWVPVKLDSAYSAN